MIINDLYNKKQGLSESQLDAGEDPYYFRVRHQTKRDIELEITMPKAWDAVGPAYATYEEAQAALKALQAKYPNERFTYTQHPRISNMGGTPHRAFPPGVAEGLPQTLRKFVPGYAKREIDKKMDAEKFGRTDVDRDANYYRYKKIQDKIKEQGVAEAASPMIKPPANRFNNKQEAFDYAKEHGGKVFKSTYIDPNTGIKNIIFVVKKEQGVAEVSLGDYRKKAAINQAGAKIDRFFGRDDPAKVAAADQTIAKREKGLARADVRANAYVPPQAAPVDLEKQQRELTSKYPNIDELVRKAELNRDPDYEMADGQAYYAARDAEQNYQKLRQIQRVIQGLNESLDRSHLP